MHCVMRRYVNPSRVTYERQSHIHFLEAEPTYSVSLRIVHNICSNVCAQRGASERAQGTRPCVSIRAPSPKQEVKNAHVSKR
jgi:hypothetical protein